MAIKEVQCTRVCSTLTLPFTHHHLFLFFSFSPCLLIEPSGPSRAPVSTKILFFEQNDANTAHSSDSKASSYFPEIKEKIQFYERLFMGSKSSGKRDVVIKHDDWKRMISDLLSQVQARESQLRESEGRADRSDKSLESSKAAYDALNDALREAYPFSNIPLLHSSSPSLLRLLIIIVINPYPDFYPYLFSPFRAPPSLRSTLMKHTRAEIGRLNTLVSSTAQPQAASTQTRITTEELEAANQELREENERLREERQSLQDEKKILEGQAAQDRHYSQCAEDKVEQLMVDLLAEQEKAKAEQERAQAEQERAQAEQEKAQAEIANLTQKLISRNAELKLYKVRFSSHMQRSIQSIVRERPLANMEYRPKWRTF